MATRKLLGAAAIVAAVAGGGIAGALIGAPLVSVAQESDGSSTTTTPPGDGSSTTTPPDDNGHACADGFRGRPGKANLDVAAKTLGLSVDDLRAALRDGKTLADIAGEKGVEVQTLVDALVADASARIDAAVASGDLSADDAAERKQDLAEHITAFVNGEGPPFGPGPGRGHGPGRGFRGRGGSDDSSSSADSGSDSSSGSGA